MMKRVYEGPFKREKYHEGNNHIDISKCFVIQAGLESPKKQDFSFYW